MKKRILLIEDMKGVRESLEIILAMQDFHVEMAADGAEGLRMAKAANFDLVITDILMPEIDGAEVILALRAAGSKTPILAISGGGNGVSAAAALTLAKAKADAVLEKPFSKADVLAAVRKLIP